MDNSQINILVAEDDENLNSMMIMVLEDEGYQVDSALNGIEAWNLLEKKRYDLLATDLFMPKMNGFDLITKCKECYPDTKIILFSGGGKEIEAEHGCGVVKFMGQEISVDEYLKKPCSLSEILSAVEKVLSD